ncbi:PREDICTED: meiotic recombination protein SPO11 [Vollenhovia emeryi]|uniref:meiotic recombination protein SPO11 n=1 Tax=Vollenhovia emeryi TaxID=411798 RepID=UPI0005F47D8B|nr:PREDICTED: meiotic recombination protein SPO11 [Vollenhovia emeryi]
MSNPNKKFCRRSIALSIKECLGVCEKYIEIPIVDNKESRKNLITRIEAATLKIIEQISRERAPSISYFSGQNIRLKSDTRKKNVYSECSAHSQQTSTSSSDHLSDFAQEKDADNEDTSQNSEKTKRKTVDFAMTRSRNKFVLMVVIMAEAHRLLISNTTKTRRSFYYDLKTKTTTSYLVPDQTYVDRALNEVANLLKCAPWDLGLLATAKGLVAGNMTITLDDQVIDCTIPGGVQIPQIISKIISIRVKANFVLVIEKDAIFQKLLEENCPRALSCILVTGKGYPDVGTRMLVKILSEKMDLPIYIVVDADPFGIDIMLIYRFGSSSLYRENETLACPNARWLGIHPSELIPLGVKTIPLTRADLAKLRTIEARNYVNEDMSKQLNILQKGKAEIEALSSFPNSLTAMYLSNKVRRKDYI